MKPKKRKRPDVAESLQDSLRRRLRESMQACPTCGHYDGALRPLAKDAGIPIATLWRFLSGKHADGSNLDKIDAYLRRLER